MSKVNLILGSSLFGESVKQSGKSNRLITKTGIGTTIGDCNRAIVEATYYREGAVASIDTTIKTSNVLFRESRGQNLGKLYREGVKEMINTIITAITKIFDAIVLVIQKGSSFFVSEAGLIRDYKSLQLRQDQLAKVFQEKGGEFKKTSFAIKAGEKSIFSVGDLLGHASNLANPDLFVSFDITEKKFVGEGEVPNTAEGLKALVSGGGATLANEAKARTVAALASYVIKFKEYTTGAVDETEKEWLKNAAELSKTYASKGIAVADVFAAYAAEHGLTARAAHKNGEARGGFGSWMTQLSKVEIDPAKMPEAQATINALIGKGAEDEMSRFLAKYKANAKTKTSVFYEMSKQAKEWRKAFTTANKDAKLEKGSDEKANSTVIANLLKSYVAAMNDMSKTFTDLVRDARDGALLAVKTYNEAITKVLAAYGVKGKEVAKAARVKKAPGEKTSLKTKATNAANRVKGAFKRKPKTETK